MDKQTQANISPFFDPFSIQETPWGQPPYIRARARCSSSSQLPILTALKAGPGLGELFTGAESFPRAPYIPPKPQQTSRHLLDAFLFSFICPMLVFCCFFVIFLCPARCGERPPAASLQRVPGREGANFTICLSSSFQTYTNWNNASPRKCACCCGFCQLCFRICSFRQVPGRFCRRCRNLLGPGGPSGSLSSGLRITQGRVKTPCTYK